MASTFEDIARAVETLRSGGVVAFPTETVYGLGADAMNAAAVERVYALKGRPRINPLIVHVSGPEMASRVVAPGAWTTDAAALARAFWPGPLSIVLPRHERVPDLVTAGASTVAVRCPDHSVALALLFDFGAPLVGPSANLSGQVSPTTAEHVRASFAAEDVPVLEGGACRGGIESTVVLLAGETPRVLRPGLISAEQIAEVIGREVLNGAGAVTPAGEPLASPGLLARHYAPGTPARLLARRELIGALEALPTERTCAVISHTLLSIPGPHRLFILPDDAEGYAARLYAMLREADAARVAELFIERPESDGPVWAAIRDRLVRATTP